MKIDKLTIKNAPCYIHHEIMSCRCNGRGETSYNFFTALKDVWLCVSLLLSHFVCSGQIKSP